MHKKRTKKPVRKVHKNLKSAKPVKKIHKNVRSFKVLVVILIVLSSLLILLDNFKFLANNNNFYQHEFSKYDVYSKYPDADKINNNLLAYLNSKGALDESIFLEIELAHLRDVRYLMHYFTLSLEVMAGLFLLLAILLLILSGRQFLGKFLKVLFFGAIFSVVIVAVVALLPFDLSFVWFHKLLFHNNYWMLPPGALTTIYSEDFFYDFSVRWFLTAIATSLAAFAVAVIGLAIKKEKFFKL